MAATVSKPKPVVSHNRKYIGRQIQQIGQLITNTIGLFVQVIINSVTSLALLAVFGALFAMYAPQLYLDPAETIARFMVSFCVPGSTCNFNEVYGGLGLALFLVSGTVLFIGICLRGLGKFDLGLLDDDEDENLTDIVLEEIEMAARHGKSLTAKEITERSGLERTVVQECLGCLSDDLEIVALYAGVGPTRWTIKPPDAEPKASDE